MADGANSTAARGASHPAGLRVAASLVALALKSLPQRRMPPATMAVGVGVTTGIFVAVLAMAQSLTGLLRSQADASRVIVLAKGAQWEEASQLSRDAFARLTQSRCVAEGADGQAAASPVALASTTIFGPDDNVDGMAIRGYRAEWLAPALPLAAGRWPRAGMHELAVGEWAARQIPGTGLGSDIPVGDHRWPVVGVFAGESSLAGAFVADADAMLDEYGRGAYNSASATLASGCDADALAADLAMRGLDAEVVTEVEYAAQVAGALGTFRTLSLVLGVPMLLGAAFCAFGVASAVVHGRRREIGILLATGFRPGVVAAALVAELTLIAAACALLACIVATVVMSGELVTFGVDGGSLTFAWQASAPMVGAALAFATVAALLGAAVPAIRLARGGVPSLLHAA